MVKHSIATLKSYVQQVVATPERYYSGIITLIISLIAITPLCGYLFQCGCDWTWLGLDRHCNFHQTHAKYSCPWCASLVTGMLATACATSMAVISSTLSIESLARYHLGYAIVARVLLGLIIFIWLALIAAFLAAVWQNYPLGIGEYIN